MTFALSNQVGDSSIVASAADRGRSADAEAWIQLAARISAALSDEDSHQ